MTCHICAGNTCLGECEPPIAYIGNLEREALEDIVTDAGGCCNSGYSAGFVARNALASTPAQSLQEHDNEVIERVVTLLKDTAWSDGIIDMRVSDLIEDVRALKGKQNE